MTPLLPPFAYAMDGRRRVDFAQGSEREIAILFADIRGFTALSEGRLPYDVVFILNRYFAAVGRAVESAGGRVDKFLGDGVMALFGIESGAQQGCREALTAARLMSERMGELNASLRGEIERPLRIGIGIHAGPIIIGEMGYGGATAMTAIGDAVNTASRLEELTKEYTVELVVSEAVVSRAGFDLSGFPRQEVEIRGKTRDAGGQNPHQRRRAAGIGRRAGSPHPDCKCLIFLGTSVGTYVEATPRLDSFRVREGAFLRKLNGGLWQHLVDFRDDPRVGGRDLGRPGAGQFAVGRDQEFVKVPARGSGFAEGFGDPAVERMGLGADNPAFLRQREVDGVIGLAELLDLGRRSRLLLAEIIGRHAEHDEPPVAVALPQRLETAVLRRVSAERPSTTRPRSR